MLRNRRGRNDTINISASSVLYPSTQNYNMWWLDDNRYKYILHTSALKVYLATLARLRKDIVPLRWTPTRHYLDLLQGL